MVARGIIGAAALLGIAYAQDDADATTLLPDAIQTGSFFDGTDALGASDEQAPAQTSQNNFINFCSGKTLTDGLQIVEGSCNGIVMGDIPAKTNMISTIVLNPQNGDEIQSGQDFRIEIQVNGLIAGAFTNAVATYYSSPQFLENGNIVGHTHVTVQDLGQSLNPQVPPDPQQFAFFKGINDEGDGNGRLFADVEGGLPPGNYRVCTLTSGANHQPVVMPVAQRGAQDDCTKFVVVGDETDPNDRANDGQNGIDAAADAAAAVELGPGAIEDDAADQDQDQDQDQNQGQDQDQGEDQNQNQDQGQDQNQNQGQDQNQGQNQNQGQGQNDANAQQNNNNNNNNNNNANNNNQGQNGNAANNNAGASANQFQGQNSNAASQAQENNVQADEQDAQDQQEDANQDQDQNQDADADADEFVNDRASNGANGIQAAQDAAAAVALGPGALTADAAAAAATADANEEAGAAASQGQNQNSQAQDNNNNNNGAQGFQGFNFGGQRRRAVRFSS